ncbi:MAG TPA: hypothetical protein VGA97_00835 [Acidimicrobiia bacterium]
MLVCVVSLSALLVALPAFAKGSELSNPDPGILDQPEMIIAGDEPVTVPAEDAPDQTQSAPVAPPVREGPSVEPVVEGAGVDQDGSGMSSWWWPAALGALALIGLVMVNHRNRVTAAESSQDPISARPAKSH